MRHILLSSLCVLFSQNAHAKDLKILADTLSSNFLAQQVTKICAVDSATFVKDTTGPLGDANTYAARVKDEVILGLASDEADYVVREAANDAKFKALQLLKRLSLDGQVQQSQMQNWCAVVGKPFVLSLESLYDTHHPDLERELNNAKR